MSSMPMSARCASAVMVFAALVGGGCTDVAPDVEVDDERQASPSAGPPSMRAVRIAALEDARVTVGPVVTGLDSAGGQLASLVTQWRDNREVVDLATQVDSYATAATDAIAAAEGALDPDASVDVATADEHLQEMATLVAAQRDAARALAADEQVLRQVDQLGETFTATINDRGSRTPQRQAMQGLVESMNQATAQVDQRLAVSSCPAPLQARRKATAHMREVAEQLAELATAGQGHAFDQLRAQATQDPFGQQTTDLESVASATTCEAVATVVGGPETFADLRADLEAALNPPDLVE